ncbi:MAG: hypothetical protein RBS49_02740 [Sphaerochaeta sp.]|nr:hypothetical protein [Sphaerochaeta sp.]MDX9914783.1 hypothetical protein [Sphaerochaeta sp.]
MRSKATVVLVGFLLTLVSCSGDAQVRASLSEELVIVTIQEDRRMAVLLFDGGEDVFADSMGTNRFEGEELAILAGVLRDLAIVEGRMGSGERDGQAMLDALREGASGLRKTRLADTLAKVSGQDDSLGTLARLRTAELFDLRGHVDGKLVTNAWLARYIAEIRRYLRRR